MQPEYDESDDESNSISEYPYLDCNGQLHLKNSSFKNNTETLTMKNSNGNNLQPTTSDLNEKISDTTSLLQEHHISSPKTKKSLAKTTDIRKN
jgi:hypothetical protein